VVLREVNFITTFCEPAVFTTVEVVILTSGEELCVRVQQRAPFEARQVDDISVVAECCILREQRMGLEHQCSVDRLKAIHLGLAKRVSLGVKIAENE